MRPTHTFALALAALVSICACTAAETPPTTFTRPITPLGAGNDFGATRRASSTSGPLSSNGERVEVRGERPANLPVFTATPTIATSPVATPSIAAPPIATLTPLVRDTSDPAAAVDALVRDQVADGEPGMAVLVMRGGRPVLSRGYGIAELATQTRIDARTTFRLASVSKQFTAMIVMMLAEQGVLAYDDPISRFVPEVVAGHPGRRDVTIRNLLQHTSGIPDYLELLERQGVLDEPNVGTAEVVRRIAEWRAHSFRAGTRYEYSNSNYVLLAAIAERAAGQPFATLLRTRILRPLEMPTAVVFDDGAMVVPGRARGYDLEEGGRRGARSFELDDSDSPILGDDGIFASLEDFVRWEGALSSEQLVRRETLDLAFTSGTLRDGSETGYGFGWNVEGRGASRRVSHDGSWAGFRTAILRAPDLGLTVVVLSNRGDVEPDEIAANVIGIYSGAHEGA